MSDSPIYDTSEAMKEHIAKIRGCKLGCYTNNYITPIKTRGRRTITVEELKNGRPLVDDWRGQDILFISQAPSKQAWADHELSSMDNSFFTDFLFPKIYPDEDLNVAIEKWQNNVFWLHTSNCYPGKGNGGRDNPPDFNCADMYFDEIINTMKPKCIILMGMYAAHYFTKNGRLSLNTRAKKPLLSSILDYQYSCQRPLRLISNDGKHYYQTIVFKHARDESISPNEKFAINLVVKVLTDKEQDILSKPATGFIDKRKSPAKHSWLEEIIDSLEALGGDAINEDLFNEIKKRGIMSLTSSWKNSVRKTIDLHSSDSGSYVDGKPDIFYMIEKGHWGMRKFKDNSGNTSRNPSSHLLHNYDIRR